MSSKQTTSFLVFLMLFVVVKSVKEDEIFCARGHFACSAPRQTSFPGNEEELDLFCMKAIRFFSCKKRLHEVCPERDANVWKEYSTTLKSLHSVCDEDSQLHRDLVEHIGCIKQSLLNYNASCRELAKEVRGSAGFRNAITEEDYEKFGCLHRMIEVTCVLTKLGQSCGNSAENTALNVIRELDKKYEFCPGSSLKEVEEILLTQEIEAEMKTRFYKIKEIIQY